MLQTTNTTPCEFLRRCLLDIKRCSPRLSSTQIAQKVKVPKSSLGRIENLEVERPSYKHAINIVRVAYPDEPDHGALLEKHYPEMAQVHNRVYSGNKDVSFVETEVEQYFEDPTTHEFMMLATSDVGITEALILDQYGKRGLQKIKDLMAKGILVENDGVIRLGKKRRVNAGQSTVQKFLGNLIDLNYNSDSFGDKLSWLTVQYDSIDKELVLPQLVDELRKMNQNVRNILRAPASRGKDVVWIGLAMDDLGKEGRLQ